MAQNDPIKETITVWAFTEEDIYHRWDVHQRFDLLNRYAKAHKPSQDKPTKDKPVNTEEQLNLLERILPEQGES